MRDWPWRVRAWFCGKLGHPGFEDSHWVTEFRDGQMREFYATYCTRCGVEREAEGPTYG